MSQENLDLVMRAMTAANVRPRPDFQTLNALFASDHLFVPVEGGKLGGEEVVGGEGYRGWLKESGAALSWEAKLEGAVDLGPEKVLAVQSIHFRGASSGIELNERMWIVFQVSDGKIIRTEAFLDSAEALEAARLSE